MALQHLRSSTANKRPTPAAMSDGQLAMNTNSASPGLFLKDSSGALVKVGPVHVGTTAPNASPASGGQSGNTVGEQWLDTSGSTYVFKIWDGSAWRSEAGEFVNATGDVMTGALGIIAGLAGSPGLYFSGSTSTGIYSPGADQLAISTNGTGRLFIDSSGRVGIGTSNQNFPLSIQTDSSAQSISLFGRAADDISEIKFLENDQTTVLGELQYRQDHLNFRHRVGYMSFSTGGVSERMRLTADGKLGLGTSSPSVLLHLAGSAAQNARIDRTGSIAAAGENYGSIEFVGRNSTGSAPPDYSARIVAAHDSAQTASTRASSLSFFTQFSSANASEKMRIDSQGRVGIGTTSPGYALDVAGDIVSRSVSGATRFVGGDYDSGNYRFGLRHDLDSRSAGIIATSAAGNAPYIWFGLGSGTTTATERARITSSGQLLVGTSSSSSAALLITQGSATNSAASSSITLARGQNNPSDGFALGILGFSDSGHVQSAQVSAARDGGTWTSGSSQPTRLMFSTTADGASSPTERMRIAQDGQTNIYANLTGLQVRSGEGNNTNSYVYIGRYGATSTSTGTISFGVRANGNVENQNNSYGAISDIKLKENIVEANSQWDDLKSLQVRNYNFKPETGYSDHTQIGLVAQEVELVSPGLVTESPDLDKDGNDLGTVTKSVNYSVLYMKAVKALQEAMERIEALEAKVATLEAV
jgi:hypothetical protein